MTPPFRVYSPLHYKDLLSRGGHVPGSRRLSLYRTCGAGGELCFTVPRLSPSSATATRYTCALCLSHLNCFAFYHGESRGARLHLPATINA